MAYRSINERLAWLQRKVSHEREPKPAKTSRKAIAACRYRVIEVQTSLREKMTVAGFDTFGDAMGCAQRVRHGNVRLVYGNDGEWAGAAGPNEAEMDLAQKIAEMT